MANNSKNNNTKDNGFDDFKNFFGSCWGGIIGAIIGLAFACTSAYRIVIGIIIIVSCCWAGYYFQYNKEKVKNALKNFIDKL
jgi:uncharacterized membrane protein YfcA